MPDTSSGMAGEYWSWPLWRGGLPESDNASEQPVRGGHDGAVPGLAFIRFLAAGAEFCHLRPLDQRREQHAPDCLLRRPRHLGSRRCRYSRIARRVEPDWRDRCRLVVRPLQSAHSAILVLRLARAVARYRSLYPVRRCQPVDLLDLLQLCASSSANWSWLGCGGSLRSLRGASLCSIGNDHPFVPTCPLAERRAQRQSRMLPRTRRHRRSRRAASLTERARC